MELEELFKETTAQLIALSDEVRQDIVLKLAKSYPKALRVCEIQPRKCLARPSLSHHFKVLLKANLIKCYHEGTKNYYYLCPSALKMSACMNLFSRLSSFNEVKDNASR